MSATASVGKRPISVALPATAVTSLWMPATVSMLVWFDDARDGQLPCRTAVDLLRPPCGPCAAVEEQVAGIEVGRRVGRSGRCCIALGMQAMPRPKLDVMPVDLPAKWFADLLVAAGRHEVCTDCPLASQGSPRCAFLWVFAVSRALSLAACAVWLSSRCSQFRRRCAMVLAVLRLRCLSRTSRSLLLGRLSARRPSQFLRLSFAVSALVAEQSKQPLRRRSSEWYSSRKRSCRSCRRNY